MSVARGIEGLAPSSHLAIQHSRRVGRRRSPWWSSSYRRPLLGYPWPTTLPPHTRARPRRYELEGKLICKLVALFWGRNLTFLPSNWFLGASTMTFTASFGWFVDVLINELLILHVRIDPGWSKVRDKGLGVVRWAFISIWPTLCFSPLPHRRAYSFREPCPSSMTQQLDLQWLLNFISKTICSRFVGWHKKLSCRMMQQHNICLRVGVISSTQTPYLRHLTNCIGQICGCWWFNKWLKTSIYMH
jgi:hypothetical protein